MNLSKNTLVALRCLPTRYVKKGVLVVEYGPHPGCVFAMVSDQSLSPICYYPQLKKWKKVIWKSEPGTIKAVTGVTTVGRRCFVLTPEGTHEGQWQE